MEPLLHPFPGVPLGDVSVLFSLQGLVRWGLLPGSSWGEAGTTGLVLCPEFESEVTPGSRALRGRSSRMWRDLW